MPDSLALVLLVAAILYLTFLYSPTESKDRTP